MKRARQEQSILAQPGEAGGSQSGDGWPRP